MLPRQQFIVAGLLFVIGGAVFLAVILVGAALRFPPPVPTRLTGPSSPGLPSVLRRFRKFMEQRPKRQRFIAPKTAGRLLAAGTSGTRLAPRTVSSDPRQLAFRETIVAQFFAKNFFSRAPEDSWEQAQDLSATGPWRGYELDRLKARLLGEQFDESKDPSLLPEYRSAALRAAQSSYVNFEDYFWAGHACLYNRDEKQAAQYFQRAEETWPARDSFYGYIYLFLICTDAIEGRGDQVLEKFKDFQAHFPDWLYIEIYVIEVTELERVYPKAPLLQVLEGEIFAMVQNDARALAAYRRAIELGGLDGATEGRVRLKIREIERNL
jgi:hypothetical protein